MLKKVLLPILSLVLTAGVLAGCTPKAVSLWCYGLGEGAEFLLEYSVSQNSYDGQNRTFTVKDAEVFAEYLQSAEGFAGICDLADEEGDAYLFISGGNGYFCTERVASENSYKLTPCSMMIERESGTVIFAYPPTADPFTFAEGNTIATVRDWAYFTEFYSQISGVQVDNTLHTITMDCYRNYAESAVGTVELTYADGTLTYTVSENE